MEENKMSYQKTEDKRFYMQLLKDIPYFHELYAKYKKPESLKIAQDLGIAAANIKKKIETYDYSKIDKFDPKPEPVIEPEVMIKPNHDYGRDCAEVFEELFPKV